MRQIAISDIHGCAITFRKLIKHIVQLTKEDELYLLGDYVDRGPDSKGVIDYIMLLKKEGYQVHLLRGNHEEMMFEAKKDFQKQRRWLNAGGNITVKSFGVQHAWDIPQEYFDFLEEHMKHYIELDNYYLVHAGFNFEKKNPLKDKDAMLWIRRWSKKINKEWLNGKVIVHGHTPTALDDIQVNLQLLDTMPVLDIDGGCFAKDITGTGYLCAFDLTNKTLFYQKNLDDMTDWVTFRRKWG